MKHNRQKSAAFTLIELLIASTIFAMIMVIVVGTFSWAAGYNSRLKETRKVAQNGRMIMSEISTQVRLANGKVKYRQSSSTSAVYIGEVVLLNCSSNSLSTCDLVGYNEPKRYKINPDIIEDPVSSVSNAVLILQKDQNKAIFYRTLQSGSGLNFNFVKKEIKILDWSGVLTLTDFGNLSAANAINDTSVTTKIYFGGYGPASDIDFLDLSTNKIQQPFVEFYLIGKSANYDSLRPTNRAKFEVKSLVETRYYN